MSQRKLTHNESQYTEHFICNLCDSRFDRKRILIRHLKSQCEKNVLKPTKINLRKPRCKNRSQDYEEILVDDGQKLNGDIRKKFKEISECPQCKTQFSSRKNLYKHLKTIHQVLDPDIQVEEHKPKIGHRCSICEKVFSLRKNLFQHLRKVHGKTNVGRKSSSFSESIKLICDACGVGFSEKKSLMRHLRTKHLVKLGREKKTVAVCVHCSSTFAHKKSLYKHERKFHGAEYKKILKDYSASNENHKKHKENCKNPGNIEDYACLKEILPDHYDYKLTQFSWLKEEQNCNNVSSNWFKAKLNFTCQTKEDVKKWTEVYEMQNKLCLRVLSFPRPRTPGVLYKGRFRCHHNTMPKKGAKPNAKHTACSAVLSITLLQMPAHQHSCENSAPYLKALIFMKNTHNHVVGDPASLKYRKPIRQVKEKFLKFFQEKKTVPQALAAHKADLQAEYDDERFSYVVKDRAFMPDARWAYGLYYSYYKKKSCDLPKDSTPIENGSTQHSITVNQTNSISLPVQNIQTSRHKSLAEKLNDVFQLIIQRCESSPAYFQSSIQNFISSYESNCVTNAQLSNALNYFTKYDTSTKSTKNKVSYVKTIVDAPEVADFSVVDDSILASSSSAANNVVSPIFKYATFSSTCSRTIRQPQTIPCVARTSTLTREKDIILPQSNTFTVQSAAATNATDMFETRPVYAIETTDKYDDCILYPIENRQNITNCWTMSTDYAMF